MPAAVAGLYEAGEVPRHAARSRSVNLVVAIWRFAWV